MSSLCRRCDAEGRTRRVPDGREHVHALPEGALFRGPRGRVRRVVEKSRGRVEVSAGRSSGREVSFETRGGREVEFEVAPSSKTDTWSPTAIVRPLREEDAP